MNSPKITFSSNKIGFDSVVKVSNNGVYTGRIVFNSMGRMEYREKGSKNLVEYKQFNDKDKIKKYVIDRITAQNEMNQQDIDELMEIMSRVKKLGARLGRPMSIKITEL